MKKQGQRAEPGDQREQGAGSCQKRAGPPQQAGAGPPGKWAGRAVQDGAGSLLRRDSILERGLRAGDQDWDKRPRNPSI